MIDGRMPPRHRPSPPQTAKPRHERGVSLAISTRREVGFLADTSYFYAVGDDFGSFFVKFCSYLPYYESLDNGVLCSGDAEAMQRLADSL